MKTRVLYETSRIFQVGPPGLYHPHVERFRLWDNLGGAIHPGVRQRLEAVWGQVVPHQLYARLAAAHPWKLVFG